MTGVWLGVDIGTSGVKVVAVDGTGEVLATEVCAYALRSPRPGWVEQSPHDWWEGTVRALRSVIGRVQATAVAGIGLTGQMHGLVAMEHNGEVLRDAILWNDNRNAEQCAWVVDRVGSLDALLGLTGNAALPGYTVGKILWVRDNEPDLFSRIDVVLNPKDYLRYRLTGDRVTDVSDASGTGLFDVRRRVWSTDLLSELGLPDSVLPPVVESPDITGSLAPAVAETLGLPAGVPVVGGGGDSVLQTTSMGIDQPGILGITLGTAGIVAAATDICPDNVGGRVQVSCNNAPDLWHIMGVSLTTGGALQWWRSALAPLTGREPDAACLGDLAARSPVGARGIRFLPYLVGERCPHTDPEARGAWTGLDLRHDLTDLTRAVIEGALLNLRQTRDLFADLGLATDDVRVSGGASVHPIWSQTLADVLNTSVQFVSGGEHGAAYGAALLAGVGTGQWSSVHEALGRVRVTGAAQPDPRSVAIHDESYAEWRRLYPAIRDARTTAAGSHG